jgi:hypothetical protein
MRDVSPGTENMPESILAYEEVKGPGVAHQKWVPCSEVVSEGKEKGASE